MKPTQVWDIPRIGLHKATIWALWGLALCLITLGAKPAKAQEFRLNVEPAAAIWLDTPQSDRFTPGFYGAIRPGVSLGRVVSLQWSYALLFTPAGDGFTEDGTAHFALAGVRLRPFATLQDPTEQLGGFWFDMNLGYARTGDLDRFAFDAGLGYNFQVSDWFALGPSVRYAQIVQDDDVPDVDANDGQFLAVGIDFAFGPAHKEDPVPEPPKCPDAPECVQVTPPVPVALPCAEQKCLDRDEDGICDIDDRCPTVAGEVATFGCPIDPCGGEPLLMLVQFEDDSATLPPREQSMEPMLDAVAAAIAKDSTCRVCIIGNASDEGTTEHNQDLSARRAKAVQGYLAGKGLEKSRIPSTGLGERCQLTPATTRVLNRRVEFRRLDVGESCPSDCSK